MSEDGFSDCFDEPSMEIQIDTLMGTSFDMRVSATDTVREIKQRIQRVEGIPVHQQNLIFQSKELKDSRRLCDAGIKTGSSIKLVIAMKGGPISTRRLSVSCEHHTMLKELKDLLENTRDEIGDKLAPGSKVSVLVFKEGDILNLLRVIENEDGSYSPYSEKPISPPAKPGRGPAQSAVFDKLVEDTDMMAKVSGLRKRMEDVSLRRQLKTREARGYKLLAECGDVLESVDLSMFERGDGGHEVALKDKHRARPRKPEGAPPEPDLCLPPAAARGLVLAGGRPKGAAWAPEPRPFGLLRRCEEPEFGFGEVCSGELFRRFAPPCAPRDCARAPLYGRGADCARIQRLRNEEEAPEALPPPAAKKRARCGECHRRLNITNMHSCRCGRVFCAQHRYSEAHGCSYDYKAEGRRVLEHQNPLVTADKVSRI